MINVVIADDHELFRDGLKVLLGKETDITIKGEAANGKDLVELAIKLRPDIILTDIVMPGLDGIAATREIKKIYPEAKIIALSMFDQEDYVLEMMEAGASGYLLKNAEKNEIIESIHSVNRDMTYFSGNTSARFISLVSKSSFNPFRENEPLEFSEKETAIIRLICAEKTTKEIADELFLSIRTIEGYRQRLEEKMNVKNTAGIVIYAIKKRIFQISN
jgi:DNA-binding NarL/FixJ family response regulator